MNKFEPDVLLFDLGGVLIENQMFSELKRLMHTDKSEAQLIEMWLTSKAAREFELGRCSPNEFANSIIEQFGLQLGPREFLDSFKSWPKGFYPGAEPLLAELKLKFRICCLSNSNEVHWTSFITGHFEHALSSHLLGCIKPDREAFDTALKVIDVAPDKVCYFDDAALNVDAARSCGMLAHHTIGFDALRSTLHDLRLLADR